MNAVRELELKAIQSSKLNPRKHFDDVKLKELAASIKEKGILQPIVVRPSNGKYEIVCGERRFRAVGLAGLPVIPAIVRELDDKQVLEIQVIENLQREDVHPLEEAEGYEALMKKHGYKSVDDIAAKVGKSKAYVYGRLKLCELTQENRKLFYEGKLLPSVALLVARVPADLQKEAGSKAANGNWGRGNPMSSREAAEYIHQHYMLQLKEAQFDTKEKGLAGRGSCAECARRTGNQAELFADVSGKDTCTDPTCFEAKKTAFAQRAVEALKKQGKTVVSREEAMKLFPYQSADPEHKYVNLDHHDWDWPKDVTLRKCIKAAKDVEVVHAIHPQSGKVIEMVEKSAVPRILKAAGIKMRSDSAPAKDLVAVKKEKRIRESKYGFWVERIRSSAQAPGDICCDVVVLSMILSDLGYLTAEEFCEKNVPGYNDEKSRIQQLYKLGEKKIQELIKLAVVEQIERIDDTDLEFLCAEHGFSVDKDYVITETYLQALTKDQLVALAKEIGIDKIAEAKVLMSSAGTKKADLVRLFIKTAPEKGFVFKGKVPKELQGKKK